MLVHYEVLNLQIYVNACDAKKQTESCHHFFLTSSTINNQNQPVSQSSYYIFPPLTANQLCTSVLVLHIIVHAPATLCSSVAALVWSGQCV